MRSALQDLAINLGVDSPRIEHNSSLGSDVLPKDNRRKGLGDRRRALLGLKPASMPRSSCACAAEAGACAALQSPVGPMGQFLYSVYVHSGPDYPGYKEGSLFHGREVPGRVQVCHLIHMTQKVLPCHPCPFSLGAHTVNRHATPRSQSILARTRCRSRRCSLRDILHEVS